MYVPALKAGVGEKLCAGAFDRLHSLAFCLEDAVTDSGVKDAEAQLVKTLAYIDENKRDAKLPLLFVRVRNCTQFKELPSLLGERLGLLSGVIFPKFDLFNAAEYCSISATINLNRKVPIYIMPILESGSVINLASRKRTLLGLRELLDGYREHVLNIRVGAMDFCKSYGLRRTISQTIYDINVVRDVLTDILTVFADDYVVSAPVWEYFADGGGSQLWKRGMEKELQLDIANGFTGKTIIHPSQVEVVVKWLKPSRVDVMDAKAVTNWDDGGMGVAKSTDGNRMNEVATHVKWARRILTLSEIYGERDA
jgi:citrate lyase beta subunit